MKRLSDQLDFAKSVGISLFYLQMAKRPTVEISGQAFWSTLHPPVTFIECFK